MGEYAKSINHENPILQKQSKIDPNEGYRSGGPLKNMSRMA
jgi:hypothetical protein